MLSYSPVHRYSGPPPTSSLRVQRCPQASSSLLTTFVGNFRETSEATSDDVRQLSSLTSRAFACAALVMPPYTMTAKRVRGGFGHGVDPAYPVSWSVSVDPQNTRRAALKNHGDKAIQTFPSSYHPVLQLLCKHITFHTSSASAIKTFLGKWKFPILLKGTEHNDLEDPSVYFGGAVNLTTFLINVRHAAMRWQAQYDKDPDADDDLRNFNPYLHAWVSRCTDGFRFRMGATYRRIGHSLDWCVLRGRVLWRGAQWSCGCPCPSFQAGIPSRRSTAVDLPFHGIARNPSGAPYPRCSLFLRQVRSSSRMGALGASSPARTGSVSAYTVGEGRIVLCHRHGGTDWLMI
ncbi:uncharacterized protein B0H18DRAFT_1031521 [Fomitopsis serialis]|uniref:uncharacterized protein n=1 Tax=Fomitopsis serialis TaxID=139415 RepID=UPI002007F252|nr:uncharacterized protein B0H18DRAFT_1031521 [Neoantrodia serialis]KAH9918313.1 hypothetical protein B0H18DRAFT_1031521 [Neoantrodia serialis]